MGRLAPHRLHTQMHPHIRDQHDNRYRYVSTVVMKYDVSIQNGDFFKE